MRRLLQKWLYRPVLWLTNRYNSRPNKQRIFKALSDLLADIEAGKRSKGLLVPFNADTGKFIIFSDQHKGARNGADDFMICEDNYLEALEYYRQNGFHYIALGDSEELWENNWAAVKKHQQPSFLKEKAFIPANAFIKIFGNHDLLWQNDPFAPMYLKEVYEATVPIYEGVVLQTIVGEKPIRIFCTHGHQGDEVSDGNWFSKFFVSNIWAPLQAFLNINPNTPAYDNGLKTLHNQLMYQWSAAQPSLLLVTGHTHQPVFESLTHLERLYRRLLFARKAGEPDPITTLEQEIAFRKQQYKTVSEEYLSLRPGYFNSGCCCFSDGDITGLEISEAALRLIKWKKVNGKPERQVLEETSLLELLEAVEHPEGSLWT
jgi:predicted phosphodiesterase